MKFEKLKEQIVGPIFTVYTAFDENLKVDYNSIEKHIDWMASKGAKIFYVMPYNSRYSQLRESEILELNTRSSKMIKKHKGTIAIVSDCIHGPTELSVEMGAAAKETGADIFASIVREKWFSNKQIFNHYASISDSVNMPLLIHEMPFLSGYDSKNMRWPIDLFNMLSEIDDIIAIKEDTKNVDYAIETLNLEPRFRLIFAGRKSYFAKLREHGVKAYLNSISMIEPKYGFDFWNLMQSGTDEQLNSWLDKYDNSFWDGLVKKYGWHRCNKAALEAAGFMKRIERLPLQALSNNEFQDVIDWYNDFKVKRDF